MLEDRHAMSEASLQTLTVLLRVTTIAVCLVAILCLLYFLMFTFFIIPLALLIIVQIILLAVFLAFEINRSRSLGRHAVVLVLVLAMIGAGFYFTTSFASNFVPKPRSSKVR